MKNSKNGLIGLLVVMFVGLAILGSLWASNYQASADSFTGQIIGQLERPWNILNHVVSNFSSSTSEQGNSTWKIYSNNEYGFQFQYPTDVFLAPTIQIDPKNPAYPTLNMKYIGTDPVLGYLKDNEKMKWGLRIQMYDGGETEYQYYKSSYDKNPKNFATTTLDNQVGYKSTDPLNFGNGLLLFKLNANWLMLNMDMMTTINGCKTGLPECGLNEVVDVTNDSLFNQIKNSFKFLQ